MNCLLAIELSTPRGHIAAVRADGSVLVEHAFTSNRSHNSMLYTPLEAALHAADRDLDGIVVGTGPGSYTGVRIAIAVAQGIAIARGVPIYSIPSVLSFREADEYLAVGDARRGLFHGTLVRHGRSAEPMVVLDQSAMDAWLARHAGLPCFTSDAAPPAACPAAEHADPDAIVLARHVLAQKPAASTVVEPLYVQEAFITKARTQTMPPAPATPSA